ncbi:hypothetical protein G6F35_016258 [Rhizopus arrhizus]|nr:hypothetical protein G6F35_016258 [Rhizopus arrhizus]
MGRLAGRDVRSARYRRCRQGSRFRGAGGHSRGGGRAGHRQRAHGHQLAPAAGAGLGFPCGRRLHTAGAHHFRTTLDGTPYPACLPARGAGRSQPRPVTVVCSKLQPRWEAVVAIAWFSALSVLWLLLRNGLRHRQGNT